MANEKVIDVNAKSFGKIALTVIIIFVLLIVVASSFTTVKAGHTGVILTFEKVSDVVLDEGLHLKIPFVQRVVMMDNMVKKAEAHCSAASKDLQTIESDIAVGYRVLNSKSAELYRTVGTDFQNIIITPAVQECVKAVSAQFSAEELVSRRQSVSELMSEQLKLKVASYGIEIREFNITSFEFTAEYNAAIEAKQVAEQQTKKAEEDLKRIKIEAEMQIESAQAEAEAYRLKSLEITPEILIMNYIDKWDGKLPTVSSGENNSMIIDISALLDEIEASAGEDTETTTTETETAATTPVETETVTETTVETETTTEE